MTEIHANSSGSDISSDSWTLLDQSVIAEKQNSNHSFENTDVDIEIEPENLKQQESQDEARKRRHDGFLTFDEYLQEHLLEHDYEHQEKPQKLRRMYKNKLTKGFRKCKAQSLGISVLITIILGLSAFATLCSTLSQPPIEKEIELHMPTIKSTNSSTHLNELLEKFNETMKDLEEIKTAKLLPTAKEDPNYTISKSQLKIDKPTVEPKYQAPSIQKTSSFPKCNAPNFIRSGKIKSKPVKTKWTILKEILLDTNLHALVSLIMTNVYLFTLLVDFAKKPSQKSKCQLKQSLLEDVVKSNDIEEIRKFLFKELPFWNSEFTSKDLKKKKSHLLADRIPRRINTAADIQNKKLIDNLLFKSCPFLSEHAITPVVVPPTTVETGKSECQRRFEELDQHQKKFDNLKQAQRNRIKLLKQKFRNEVSYIKDTEEESDTRAEKISKTSQMFIRKLKYNREKYLLELKKVRELRHKVAEAKKKDSKKDVPTSSYSVSLPPIYDYGERFKMIKEKFERENDQIPKEFRFK